MAIEPQRPRNKFHRLLAQRGDIDAQLGGITRAIEGVERAIRSLDKPEEDDSATLYAAGVEPNGRAADTPMGRWLYEAGYPSVQELAKQSAKLPPEQARHRFVQRMQEAAGRIKNLPNVADRDLHRFVDSVHNVVKRLKK